MKSIKVEIIPAENQNQKECFWCDEMFTPRDSEQQNCPKCSAIYFDCGCERPYCLCYTVAVVCEEC